MLNAVLTAACGIFIYTVALLFLHRKWMLHTFVSKEIYRSPKNQRAITRLFHLGTRFDLKATAIVLLIPILLSGLFALFHLDGFVVAFSFAFLTACFLFCLFAVTLGNYFYFRTYQSHYDIFIFGLVEEDSKAVLKSIWDDYPVVKALCSVVGLSLLPAVLAYGYLTHQAEAYNGGLSYFNFILTLSVLFLCLRGTIRSKPLGKIHSQVSSISILNKMVPNGLEAILWAVKDHKLENQFVAVDLEQGKPLLAAVTGKSEFIEKTAKNDFLEANKPHVVLAVMESFGGNVLALDHPETNDLLGRLRPYFEKDFYFKRFVSTYNGTASTLMSLYFYSENQNLSQSPVQKRRLLHTAFRPYKAQGYKTVFITSGNGMWRSLVPYLLCQDIDEAYDQNDLIDIFPEAKQTVSYWGVADEFSFQLAEKLLRESDEPLFISILTITNHPPYLAPKHYVPKPITPASLQERIGKNEEERRGILSSFQYAADALGHFIERIEQSGLDEKTIIAATGDHHIRGLQYDYPKAYFQNVTVPFFVRVPEKIKAHLSLRFDPNQLGSHQDVMPTLYHLSLSDSEYWNACGQNLFSADKTHFVFNCTLWADNEGVVDFNSQEWKKFYWQDQQLLAGEAEVSADEQQKIRNYLALLAWQSDYMVTERK